MALTARRTGVAGMQVAFVFDGEYRRREPRLEPLAQALRTCGGSCRMGGHDQPCSGAAGLVFPLSHRIWGSMNTNSNRVMP